MFCNRCGTQLSDDSRFCFKCGTPLAPLEQNDMISQTEFHTIEPSISGDENPAQPATSPAPQQQAAQQSAVQQTATSSKADDGLCGMLGFIFAFFFPLVGLVLSVMGVYKKKNYGFAVAGVIISIFMIALEITIAAIIVNSLNSFDFYPYIYY